MGQKIKQQQQTPKNSHMSSVYNKQQPPKVQKHHLSTILHSSPLPTPQTIMIPALNHSSASKSTVTTAYQPYEPSSEIFISDTLHNSSSNSSSSKNERVWFDVNLDAEY